MNPPFYYHPRMLAYDFGPHHPLKPERLRRTVLLLEHFGWRMSDPEPGKTSLALRGEGESDPVEDVLRVHDPGYVELVRRLSADLGGVETQERVAAGFGSGDNPPFSGMFEASLAYVAGSAAAARAVLAGEPIAFGMAGGLHHARRAQASGFCIFNDCAVACSILREKYGRVAYIDIDVHHGDGVQWLFYDDPFVVTCSIHQDGRTLYPGTGGRDENREGVINVPLRPGTRPEEWLDQFQEGILAPLVDEQIEAIVLQMGCDSHRTDPLAMIDNDVVHWLKSIEAVRNWSGERPIVALGGGGYDLRNVPRMWTAACLTLTNITVPERIPEPFASQWGTPDFFS